MKILYGLLFMVLGGSALAQHYPIQPIPFHQVQMEDKFWKPRMEIVRTVTIPATFQKNAETGRVKNFEVAAGTVPGNVCTRFPFDDSDVYKSIEGAALSLQTRRDPTLEAEVEVLIGKIKVAQEPDGYLYSWRSIREQQKKSGSTAEPAVKGAFLD